MKRIVLTVAALLSFGLVGAGTSQVEAASPFQIHVGGRGVHVDVGRYPQARYGQQSGSYYRGHGYGGHNDWHDTTHYDYHSGQSYRHGNHSHYEPGHYDLHRGGHYDYHRGGHGGYGHR